MEIPITAIPPFTLKTKGNMDIKIKVFQLRNQGLSFGEIAKELGIGKTTAHSYYKEMASGQKPVPNAPTLVPNEKPERSERKPMAKELVIKREEPETKPEAKSGIKELTASDLVKTEFDCLEFTGKFLELIGKPSRIFSGIIWGLPKGGKSNLSVRFADYLQEYFGPVVYIAAEEGHSSSLKEKFVQIDGGDVTIIESRNRDDIREYIKSKDCSFIFIDSINVAGIDNEFLELVKTENPNKSFISIVQATKSGNFKGDQALTHNCDFVVKVVAGVASHHGRFGPASEIKIFQEALYEKNMAKPKSHPVVKNNESNHIKGTIQLPKPSEITISEEMKQALNKAPSKLKLVPKIKPLSKEEAILKLTFDFLGYLTKKK